LLGIGNDAQQGKGGFAPATKKKKTKKKENKKTKKKKKKKKKEKKRTKKRKKPYERGPLGTGGATKRWSLDRKKKEGPFCYCAADGRGELLLQT